jgi:hypothetical protein
MVVGLAEGAPGLSLSVAVVELLEHGEGLLAADQGGVVLTEAGLARGDLYGMIKA